MSDTAALPKPRLRVWEGLHLLFLALLIAGAAAAFIVPWFSRKEPSTPALEKYSPMRDGAARMTVTYGADGKVKNWSSSNDRIVPPGAAVASELRQEERATLANFLRAPGSAQPPDEAQTIEILGRSGTLYQTRNVTLEADGKATEASYLSYRDARGDFLLSVHNEGQRLDVVFEPPLQAVSGFEQPQQSWSSQGQRRIGSNAVDYSYEGRVLGREPHQCEAGDFADCLKTEAKMVISGQGKTLFQQRTLYWFAAGLGVVEWQNFDPEGKLTDRTVLASAGTALAPDLFPAPVKIAPPVETKAPGGPTELTRFAPARPGIENTNANLAPTYLEAAEPLLITAQGRELAALHAAGDQAGQVAWRFRAGGVIYGSPALDPERARLYFGATDKRLYALDARGLFLWSFETGDNIATRPVVADEVVIFGSEDRRIYGVDAQSGAARWKADAGAALAGSPVLADGLVVIGSDDGSAYALEAATGEPRWKFDGSDPIATPLVAAGARVLLTTRGSDVVALAAATGKADWTTKLGGNVIEGAPATAGGRVFVVEGGRVHALDLESGQRLWQTPDDGCTGTPAVYGQSLVVALQKGIVRQLDFDGKVMGEWSAAAGGALDAGASFQTGGVVGGSACWFADPSGVIRRWGPPPAGARPLKPAWVKRFGMEPFGPNFLNVTPAVYGSQGVVIDGGRDLYLLDPSGAGSAKKIGSLGDKLTVTMDPLVSGDTLVATVGTQLIAVHLPDGKPLWSFEGGGTSLRPASAADGLVLWFVQRQSPADGGSGSGVLFAVDLQTGQARWQRELSGFGGPGGAIAGPEGRIFQSTPPTALAAANGETIWQAQITGLPMGGPALSEDGRRLYVAAAEAKAKGGTLAALDSADGHVLWQQPLGESTLNPLERAWPAGDLVIVPLWSGEILALQAADGHERWRYRPVKPRLGGITVEGGRIWLMLQNLEVLQLDLATGEPRHRFALDIDLSSFRNFAPRPVVIGGRVVAPLTLMLGAFDLKDLKDAGGGAAK